jgi:hypothetical protein
MLADGNASQPIVDTSVAGEVQNIIVHGGHQIVGKRELSGTFLEQL